MTRGRSSCRGGGEAPPVQRGNEAAAVAGGDHDYFPADAAFLEERGELGGAQVRQLHAVLVQAELVVVRAVAGEEEEQDVLLAVHARGERLERLADAGGGGHRRRGDGVAAVDERDGAAGGAEAAGGVGVARYTTPRAGRP